MISEPSEPPVATLTPAHLKSLLRDSSITQGAIDLRGYRTVTQANELIDLGFAPSQAIVPTLLIPLMGVDKEPCGFQHRPDNPRAIDGRTIKYETPAKSSPRIDCPPVCQKDLDDPDIPLWITEGVKKADSAAVRGLCCIDLIGVWNWRGKNTKGGSVELADWDRIAIKGRIIYIAFDSDVMTKPSVKQALRRLAAVLRRRKAKKVLPVIIPTKGADKMGLDDYFAAGGSERELRDCVDLSLIEENPIITNGRSLADVAQDAVDALVAANDPPVLFVRAGELVRVTTDERGGAKLQPMGPSTLRNMCARCSIWARSLKDGHTQIFPPTEVMEDVLAIGHWPDLPPIFTITKAPVLAPDYTLRMEPGYDPKTFSYVATTETWPSWSGTVQEAVEFIFTDVLGDFPLKGAADRAHALALMLLPIVRPIISGPTPLYLIDAPVQGSGKSLLAKICLMPTMGENISATTGTKDEEEWRKKIASNLLQGRAYVFLDNLSRKVDSDTLAGVLTSTEWNDRALGSLDNINVPVRCAWIATANNAELSRDILRRTVWIRLDAGVEHPEDRTGFKHPNIEKWVGENRPQIVSALCAIIRNWVDAGHPIYDGSRLGSFEEWSRILGGILQSANVDDFLDNIDALRLSANDEDLAWGLFYERWYSTYSVQRIRPGDLLNQFEGDETLSEMLGDKGDNSKRCKLGHIIKKRVDRVAGGFVVRARGKYEGHLTYSLEKVIEPTATPKEPTATTQDLVIE